MQKILIGDTEYEFPDNMPDAEIKSALDRELGSASTPASKETGFDWRKSILPYARPILETSGATVGGLLAAPVALASGPFAPAVEAGGVGGGYLIGKKAADVLEEQAGVKTPPASVGDALVETAGQIPEAAETALGGPIVGKALGGTIGVAGKIGKQALGRLSGKGSEMVEQAIRSGKEMPSIRKMFDDNTAFDMAMRGRLDGEGVVSQAKSALDTIKTNRFTAYQEKLASVKNAASDIDMSPIRKKADSLMAQYGVKKTPKGEYDISRVAMGESGANDIKKMLEFLDDWGSQPGDKTAIGLDTLKRKLDDFYSDSSQARAFVASLRNSVKDTVVKSVPEYGEMTRDYAKASNLIKDIEAGLSMKKQGLSGRVTADQTLRRLSSAMKEDFALRKELLETLGREGGSDVIGAVAGNAASGWLPSGLLGSGIGIGGGGAFAYFNPQFLPVLAAASPRVQGEFLRMYGLALRATKGGAKLAGYGAAMAASKAGNKEPKATIEEGAYPLK